MKTIFLAEGEKHVLDALRLLIEQETELELAGEARSAEELLAHACHKKPDAILLDWNLPSIHHQRLLRTLRECCPSARLVAMSVKPEDEKVAREHGVDGFISKQLPPELFLVGLNTIIEQSKNKKEEDP